MRSSQHSPQTLLMLYRRTAGMTSTAGCATARARCSAVSSARGCTTPSASNCPQSPRVTGSALSVRYSLVGGTGNQLSTRKTTLKCVGGLRLGDESWLWWKTSLFIGSYRVEQNLGAKINSDRVGLWCCQCSKMRLDTENILWDGKIHLKLTSFALPLFFQKITVAECIETQSKAMTMLTLDQLSYLLKFALQKMKQPGVSALTSLLYLAD